MDNPRVAHSVDKFEVREERGGHEGEGYLSTRLCSEPDRCKEERPEDSKWRAIGVGEAKHAHFRLLRGARACAFRGNLQRDGDKGPKRSAPEDGEHARPCEYSARPSQVRGCEVFVCNGRVEPFQEPTCGACD
jgi:hypothetical protein